MGADWTYRWQDDQSKSEPNEPKFSIGGHVLLDGEQAKVTNSHWYHNRKSYLYEIEGYPHMSFLEDELEEIKEEQPMQTVAKLIDRTKLMSMLEQEMQEIQERNSARTFVDAGAMLLIKKIQVMDTMHMLDDETTQLELLRKDAEIAELRALLGKEDPYGYEHSEVGIC